MFGRKPKAEKPEARPEKAKTEADMLVQKTLATLDQSLAMKREAREKTQRFVGSLQPFVKAR